ncbi:probable flavin-containing monooxygenase 1 [Tanacetum coccineum]
MLHGVMAVTVAVMIVPLHTRYPPVVGVAWATEVRAPENPILVAGEQACSIPARRPETSELPLHHPSWRQVPPEEKAGVMARIGTQFDMRPHMESDRWPLIYAAIQQHLQKIYNGKKAALKGKHWIPNSDGTYHLERIRQSRPSYISEVNWDAQILFWNDPKNSARAAQNKQNRAKSKVVCRQGSRSIAALRDMHMESSAIREYPSLIHTFFLTHTVNGVFLNPEDKALYDEMLRLQGLGSNTETGVPHTKDEIMAIIREDKQRGHIPGVGRVLPGQRTGDDEDDDEDGDDRGY